jgi:hypothetical protein
LLVPSHVSRPPRATTTSSPSPPPPPPRETRRSRAAPPLSNDGGDSRLGLIRSRGGGAAAAQGRCGVAGEQEPRQARRAAAPPWRAGQRSGSTTPSRARQGFFTVR